MKYIILLLTRKCIFQCSHCEIFSSPDVSDTFNTTSLRKFFQKIRNSGVTDVIISGGEPFLYFPLLRFAVQEASNNGIKPTVWTSGYWMANVQMFELSIKYLAESGLKRIILSSDDFHHNRSVSESQKFLREKIKSYNVELGISSHDTPDGSTKTVKNGALPLKGIAFVRGRGAYQKYSGCEYYSANELSNCPHQKLTAPEYVYADSTGNIMPCPGITYGNIYKSSLESILSDENITSNQFINILTLGDFDKAARMVDIDPNEKRFYDHCHCCYTIRNAMRLSGMLQFPESYYSGLDTTEPVK
ncbi:MAG: radical SAM protein [Deltaproteobacteria bacterium]|nr:radical SAM protein [Deltaproteobacteria bacterium]